MTADDYERQIESALDVLILYPADLLELVMFVTDEQTTGRDSLPAPSFSEEKCR